ncbi:YjhT family mutarotase [Janthinobacterium sp. UMAB-60]|uniref:YjhT family mutarotase n=1 Tax=Janthinobacterium sp. UMAB-60 TaxID=1365365 RepID=UPI001C5756C7|nr:YjhT family mutarotase [Janthinobacterium sp. UMAB-60]
MHMLQPAATTLTAPFDLQFDHSWPAFPVPLREAAGAAIGGMLYAGLGSAGGAWYRLDTARRTTGWRRMADFPAAAPAGAACAASGQSLYVFGGAVTPAGHSARQSDAVWRYDIQLDVWQPLDLLLPLGLLGASALAQADGSIVLFGGYHRAQFDDFCRAHAAASEAERPQLLRAYMARPVAAFAWNRHQWRFDPRNGTLQDEGLLPFAGTCGAVAIDAAGAAVVASGEIKPGLRTPLTWHARQDGGGWEQFALPEMAPGVPQEGVAAAFGGLCAGVPVLAGGTHFTGANANYAQQQLHAHAGLAKTWCRELYGFDGRRWCQLGLLPAPRAHGLSFQVGDSLLLVGGDSDAGAATLETLAITLSNCPGRDTVSYPA